MRLLRVALAQINTTVGDLDGNTRRILKEIEEARRWGADLVAFPELTIPGYPPEDLILKPSFVRDNLDHLQEVVAATKGLTAVVGFIDLEDDVYNAAAIAHDGALRAVHHKMYLPNYGVFDENRYFQAGRSCPVLDLGGTRIGVNICEDIWYPSGPTAAQAYADAELVVNISGSPYYAGKGALRHKMLCTRAMDSVVAIAFVNLVGGQDELVFDGHSAVFDQNGNTLAVGSQFREDLVLVDLDVEAVFRQRLHDPRRRQALAYREGDDHRVVRTTLSPVPLEKERPQLPPRSAELLEGAAEVYEALVLGARDYVDKNGFQSVLIGLSGGIDSSLTAAIAADALGPERVIGVSLPSRYSSQGSKTDAEELAERLGIQFLTVPIEEAFSASLATLEPQLAGTEPGVAEENLQARIRGNFLMTLSNKFGHLVLTTGNKSEMATGYATLYGDMAGGLAVIKDVPKTLVYQLARYRNGRGSYPVIPEAVLEKPPSAELRPNQTDQDTLPPYEVLDPILQLYVEDDRSYEEIVGLGYDPETVRRVIALVDRSEYKRRQAPPGIKITPRAFGRDRRLPITNRYRETPRPASAES